MRAHPSGARRGDGTRRALTLLALVLGPLAAAACSDTDQGVAAGGADPIETTPATTTPPVTTLPPSTTSTLPPTTTTLPATTTTRPMLPTTVTPSTRPPTTVPDDSIDLGSGVFIPLPDGYSQTEEDPVTITDDEVSLTVQVVEREPGEDPLDPLQEYISLFDVDFDAITYTPSEYTDIDDGEAEIDQYSIYYDTYDADDGFGLEGGVHAFIRGDGLTMLYDVFGDADVDTIEIPGDAFDELLESFRDAPLIDDDPVDLEERETFRIESVHTVVQVDEPNLIQFTAAPGFEVITSGEGQGFVSNGSEDFQVVKLDGLVDIDTAVQATDSVIGQTSTNVVSEVTEEFDPDSFNVVRRSMSWDATYEDGRPLTGAYDIFWDEDSQAAISIIRSWYADVGNGDEPNENEARLFMFVSAATSFTDVP